MEFTDHSHLPPLAALIPKIEFPVYGLASPYLGLQLGGLNYGIEEVHEDEELQAHMIGLRLSYVQQLGGSSQVFSVESSLLPPSVPPDDAGARAQWSLASLLQLRDSVHQLHEPQPGGWPDEETLEQQFRAGLRELQSLPWAYLDPRSETPPLAGLEVTRDRKGLILGRRFEGSHQLLIGGVGMSPAQYLQAVKLLVPLQTSAQVIARHQDEFEQLTERI